MFKLPRLILSSMIFFTPTLKAEDVRAFDQGCLLHYLNGENSQVLHSEHGIPVINHQVKVKPNSLDGVLKITWNGASIPYGYDLQKNDTALLLTYDEQGISQYQLHHKIHY